MTLNGLVSIILYYYIEFGSFGGQLREGGWIFVSVTKMIDPYSFGRKCSPKNLVLALCDILRGF